MPSTPPNASSGLAKIRIEYHAPASSRVWFNNMDISGCVSRVDLSFQAGRIAEAHLTVTADDIEVDADTLAILEARVMSSSLKDAIVVQVENEEDRQTLLRRKRRLDGTNDKHTRRR